MSIIHLENNHRKINTLEEIEILLLEVSCEWGIEPTGSKAIELIGKPTRKRPL